MPTPSIGKVVQYLPAQAVDAANGVDFTQVQAGVIVNVNPTILKVFGNDGRDLILAGVVQDDTQTTPNSFTWANQAS